MRLLFGSFITFLIAAAVGLGATWLTLTRGVAFGSLTIGAWTAWPKSGSVDIDPYARANIARTGELPTGMGDGVAFYAQSDDAEIQFRRPLHLHDQRHDAGGALLDRSRSTIRKASSSPTPSTGTVSPATRSCATATAALPSRSRRWRGRATGCRPAASTNSSWCLRLYDTPIGVSTGTTKEGPMPAVVRKGCS